ncbi:hypothetical protein FH972_005546 [Carpinus fangiana]|uniref:Uncharacterized protein n=1 Tax=Carpinus fangiana TaxID=176857 RepID=A0A5N6QT29_9ROSI|nr:hypothetical protein FH972_005546 [Carpinus fangiana]
MKQMVEPKVLFGTKSMNLKNPNPPTGIVVSAEDRHPVVQEKQNEDQNECHSDWRPTGPMDGIGITSRKDVRDKRAVLGGEELDGEEEKTHRAQELGDGFFGHGQLDMVQNGESLIGDENSERESAREIGFSIMKREAERGRNGGQRKREFNRIRRVIATLLCGCDIREGEKKRGTN